jgi:arylsulfatase
MSLNKGKYKLVGNTNYDSPIESFELFDIDRDPYEIENLIDNKKKLANEMKIEMDNIYNELINSNNIINKPRIIIGSEFENPSFLNRNDASGQRGIWAQNEIFGFWRTKVYKGKYNFRFKFNNLNLKSGQMVIEVGSQVFSKKVETDENGYVLMENIHLNEGEFDLTPFFRYERKNIFPFWVEIYSQ